MNSQSYCAGWTPLTGFKRTEPMRRILLGLTALAFLIAGLIMLPIWAPAAENYFAYLCIKVGLVLGAIWLAIPQVEELIKKTPRWVWAVVGLCLIVAILPLPFFTILPIIAAICFVQFLGWMFKPPVQTKQSNDQAGSRRASRKK